MSMLIAWPWKNGTAGRQFQHRAPGVAEGDHPVEVELLQVRYLEVSIVLMAS